MIARVFVCVKKSFLEIAGGGTNFFVRPAFPITIDQPVVGITQPPSMDITTQKWT